MSTKDTQAFVDAYYQTHGPCCAGCDHWAWFNAAAGLCMKSKMVGGAERAAPLGIHGVSLRIGAGHVITPRDHKCANFVDSFDWSSLP